MMYEKGHGVCIHRSSTKSSMVETGPILEDAKEDISSDRIWSVDANLCS